MKFLALIAVASALRLGTCNRDDSTCCKCKDTLKAKVAGTNDCCFANDSGRTDYSCSGAAACPSASLSGGTDSTCCTTNSSGVINGCQDPVPSGCSGHSCNGTTC